MEITGLEEKIFLSDLAIGEVVQHNAAAFILTDMEAPDNEDKSVLINLDNGARIVLNNDIKVIHCPEAIIKLKG